MRHAIRGLVVAGLLAIGMGSSTAQAQGYGNYYPGPGYGGGYPTGQAYAPVYTPYQGGLNVAIGVGGYRPTGYGIYGNGGYPGGYQGGYAHHHHRHHRGCGHHGY